MTRCTLKISHHPGQEQFRMNPPRLALHVSSGPPTLYIRTTWERLDVDDEWREWKTCSICSTKDCDEIRFSLGLCMDVFCAFQSPSLLSSKIQRRFHCNCTTVEVSSSGCYSPILASAYQSTPSLSQDSNPRRGFVHSIMVTIIHTTTCTNTSLRCLLKYT